MRRFVFKDTEYDIKITIDIPEQMFEQIKQSREKVVDGVKELVTYTMNLIREEDASPHRPE